MKKPKKHDANKNRFLKKNKEKLTPTKLNSKENQFVKKLRILIISIVIVTTIVGSVMMVKTHNGDFNEVVTDRIPVSKDYQIGFVTHNNPGIDYATAGFTFGSAELNGDIFLETTLFSVDNPVDVKVHLSPRFLGGAHFSTVDNGTVLTDNLVMYKNPSDVPIENIGTAFPLNSFVVFLGAENQENRNSLDDNIAIINLTNSINPPEISGNGKIVFNLSGEREILVLDPEELNEYGPKIESFSKNNPRFQFFVLEPKLLPPEDIDANLAIVTNTPYSMVSGDSSEYSYNIESPDELAKLKRENTESARWWITLILAPIGILIPLYFQLTRQHTSRHE